MRRFSQRLSLEILEDRRLLATCHVIRLGDFGAGADLGGGHSRGDLRYCINKANENADHDDILVAVTGTVALTSPLPDLTSDMSIIGPGSEQFSIDAQRNGRVLTVNSPRVLLSGMTLWNGYLWGAGSTGAGLRIEANSSVTIFECVIDSNRILAISGYIYGAAIYNSGTLEIVRSTLRGNIADSTTAVGGIIYNTKNLSIRHSTIEGNRSGEFGSAIYNSKIVDIVNTTIAGNDFQYSRIIDNVGGTIYISSSTIATNTAGYGVTTSSGGKTYFRNTIIAEAVVGKFTSWGYNIFGYIPGDDLVGGGYDRETDLLYVDPLLGQLQDNGGPTHTMALLPGSPAIDTGDPDLEDPPDWDQRGPGFPRVVNGRIDIGAFEVQATGVVFAPHNLALLITADLQPTKKFRGR